VIFNDSTPADTTLELTGHSYGCISCYVEFTGNTLVSIQVVTLRWARLVLGWVQVRFYVRQEKAIAPQA